MKHPRKYFRLFLRILLNLLGLISLYVLAAITVPMIPSSPKAFSGEISQQAFLASNGVHTDLILPKTLLPEAFEKQLNLEPSIQYVAFGWGDKGFYLETPTWADLKLSVALNAALLPSPTAMHVTRYANQKQHWRPLALHQEQVDILLDYLNQGFEKQQNGNIIPITGHTYGNNDRFYEATGHYNLFLTCNEWINRGLKKAGLRTAIWSPTDKGILRYFPPKPNKHPIE